MIVKDLIEALKTYDQNAVVVVNDIGVDDETESNAFEAVDVVEGFHDGETGNFYDINTVNPDEEEVFGENAVAIMFERVE